MRTAPSGKRKVSFSTMGTIQDIPLVMCWVTNIISAGVTSIPYVTTERKVVNRGIAPTPLFPIIVLFNYYSPFSQNPITFKILPDSSNEYRIAK